MPLKKINIGIDEALHRQAKILAVLKDITLNEFLTNAIEESFQKDLSQVKDILQGRQRTTLGDRQPKKQAHEGSGRLSSRGYSKGQRKSSKQKGGL